ncbi:MAG: hypothetical protein J0H40_17725 [Rhizobiales bacterium]|nr:hypothetical protein [Hyphomicrobiales bacterium]
MSLAEGVSQSIRYKAYATGVISANTQPDSATDPAADGGQILRRVSSTLKLAKDTYQSNEIRSDRQIADFRHGKRSVTGSITGELSPKTWMDFIEASCRGTKSASVITLGPSALTSLAADNATSKFIAAGGDPVALGLRKGMVFRASSLSDANNNGKNFLITGFGGTNNRNISVFPAPETMTADTSFSLVTVGKSIFVPSSNFVSRKFGIEIYAEDIDVSRFFTECRAAGFTLDLPATGNGTIEVPFMGRDMELYKDADAPFYTAPTAETTTGIIAAVNGLLQVGGSTVGVVTGLNIKMDLSPSGDAVIGQNVVPEIFLGRANVTGQATAFFQDDTLINDFLNESEVSILAYLTTKSAPDTPAMTVYLPRVKFSDADVATSGEGGQAITMPFQALKADGTTPGDEATTIFITDTEA